MKLTVGILISAILLSVLATSAENKKTNEYVKVEISIDKKVFRKSDFGEILIKFKPKEGIHINLDPPFVINFDSTSIAKIYGKPIFKKGNKQLYLDTSRPVRQKFSFIKNMKSGEYKIKGMLSYFYCSDNEAWCSRFKQPFEFDIKVK